MSTYSSSGRSYDPYYPDSSSSSSLPARRRFKNRYNTSGERPYDITKDGPVQTEPSSLENLYNDEPKTNS